MADRGWVPTGVSTGMRMYLGADAALDHWDEIGNAEEVAWGEDDETYATLQAEHLAAADIDWDAREMSD